MLIKAYQGKKVDLPDDGAKAIIVDKGKLFTAMIYEGFLDVVRERLTNIVAIGSGSDHALTAMDCGLSAKEAVLMAAKRNNGTGGKVRTFRI